MRPSGGGNEKAPRQRGRVVGHPIRTYAPRALGGCRSLTSSAACGETFPRACSPQRASRLVRAQTEKPRLREQSRLRCWSRALHPGGLSRLSRSCLSGLSPAAVEKTSAWARRTQPVLDGLVDGYSRRLRHGRGPHYAFALHHHGERLGRQDLARKAHRCCPRSRTVSNLPS